MAGMIFWAFIGPFLGLPFLKYQIEATNNKQRFYLACVYGIGYATGATIVKNMLWDIPRIVGRTSARLISKQQQKKKFLYGG